MIGKKIISLLQKKGLIDKEDLEKIDDRHSKNQTHISEIVVDLGLVTKEQILEVLSELFGVEAVDLANVEIEKDLAQNIPERIALHHRALPIEKKDDTLVVVMANPHDIVALDDLRTVTSCEVSPLVSLDSDIRRAINNLYHEDSADAIQGIIKDELTDGSSDISLIGADEEEDTEDAEHLKQLAKETPVVKITQLIFIDAVKAAASDVLIEPLERSMRVRYRVDGLLHQARSLPKNLHPSIVTRVKIISGLNIAEHRRPQDGRFRIRLRDRYVDFRVSVVPSSHGEKIAVRILDQQSNKLSDISTLGFEKQEMGTLEHFAKQPHGMILVCGPTGSGKTTTLYTLLKMVQNPAINIVTVEDPVEFEIYGINQVAVNPDVDLTFASALRSILRQDPDVILVGEIRDYLTLDVAVKAALTGHLVLSTLHTTSAAGSITRLINMGLEQYLICSSVLMVASQRLVRKVCPRCKKRKVLSKDICKKYAIPEKKSGGSVEVYEPAGCKYCSQTGYRGRVCLIEVLPIDNEIRSLILAGENDTTIQKEARKKGMRTLREDGIQKLLKGVTTLDEVLRVTAGDQDLELT